MFASLEWIDIIPFIISIALIIVIIKIFELKILIKWKELPKGNWQSLLLALCFQGLLLFPIRGGFDIHPKIQLGIPISVSSVYFCNNSFINHAAVNTMWYFLYSITINKDNNIKKFQLLDPKIAQSAFEKLHHTSNDSTQIVLNTKRPNIILFILESFTANIIEPLDGYKGVTPNITLFCKEGILFNNFYASGTRSDKGMGAIFSSYPAVAQRSVLEYPNKFTKLPSLFKTFSNLGYQTRFYYGGDMDFVNFKAYFNSIGTNKIIYKANYKSKDYISKWGVPDHITMKRFLYDINNQKAPFFYSLFSLSSHRPYDVPMPVKIEGKDENHRFMNSAYYTDKSLEEFISEAKKQPWWKNTLIIITADHNINECSNGVPSYMPRRFQIPMIWLGGALEINDSVCNTFGDQTCIAPTLLSQIGIYDASGKFGNNMFSNKKGHAFFTSNNFCGLVSSTNKSVYDFNKGKLVFQQGTDSISVKSEMQVLVNDFYSNMH